MPGATTPKSNDPSSAAAAVFTTLSSALRSWTVTPGSPTSPFSTLPGIPPPGLKSRQTTPAMCPGAVFGSTACAAAVGTWSGGIPVSPRSATPPGWSGVFSTIPVCAVPVTLAVDGNASESEPGGLKTWTIERPSALTAPRFGSCTYMIRQVTPVANAEIAIGRNTIVLNATDQLTRSVNTAKMRPIAVTNAGTTATQIRLFLIAVVSVEVVKSVL